MPSDNTPPAPNIEKLNENLAKVEALTQRLVASLASSGEKNPALEGPGRNYT